MTTTAEPTSKQALIGVQSCGCITLAIASGTPSKEFQKSIAELIAEGGEVRRLEASEIDSIRQDPNFLPGECPHSPKGWERYVPPPINSFKVSYKPMSWKRDTYLVKVKTRYHGSALAAGEVRRTADGSFEGTTGRFQEDGTASWGDTPHEIQGGFVSKKAAGQYVAEMHAERIIREAKQRWEQREATPIPRYSEEVPTHLQDGTPIPDFKVGEVWKSRRWGTEYLILDQPDDDRHGPMVAAREIPQPGDDPHRDPEDWLMPTWTYLSGSIMTGLDRVRTAKSEKARQRRQAKAEGGSES